MTKDTMFHTTLGRIAGFGIARKLANLVAVRFGSTTPVSILVRFCLKDG